MTIWSNILNPNAVLKKVLSASLFCIKVVPTAVFCNDKQNWKNMRRRVPNVSLFSWKTLVIGSKSSQIFSQHYFAIFTGKHLRRKVPLLKDLQACNFIKKRLQHGCFPVNTANFLRTVFLTPPVTASGF